VEPRNSGMPRGKVPLTTLLLAAAVATGAATTDVGKAPAPSDVYLGLACRDGASPCGRVGVAVWLPRAVDRVEARLLGARVRLATSHAGSGRYGFRRYWTGFVPVPPARAQAGRRVRVRIAVTLAGTTGTTVRRAFLSPGWG